MSELPRAAVSALRKVAKDPKQDETSTWQAMDAAFEAVGWKDHEIMPLASELTPVQRAWMKSLAELDVDLDRFGLASSKVCRRRWLGLDAPGVLEKPITHVVGGKKRTEPLWRAIARAQRDGEHERIAKILAKMSLGNRLRALGEVNASARWGTAYRLEDKTFFDWWDEKLVARVKTQGKKWAPAFANVLVKQTAEIGKRVPEELRWPAFLALVRGNVPIDPSWDALLPVGKGPMLAPTVECILAIPPERRTKAIVGALRGDRNLAEIGLALLPRFPSAELTTLIRTTVDSGMPKKKVLEELARIGKKSPIVLDAFGGKRARKAEAQSLRCASVERPKRFSALSEVARKQLRAAGRAYDRRDVPAEARFAEEGFGKGFLAICALHDGKGKHAYDALLFKADSGAVFTANTTRTVALVIQDGVECENAVLRGALEAALSEPTGRFAQR